MDSSLLTTARIASESLVSSLKENGLTISRKNDKLITETMKGLTEEAFDMGHDEGYDAGYNDGLDEE